MMKLIYVALFLFTFFMTATAQGFLDRGGNFSKKLDPSKIPICIENCSNYVDTANCNSLCKTDATNFSRLMNDVLMRAKEPICGLDLSNITFGEVEIPLSIHNESRRCSLKGPLKVVMNRVDTYAISLDNCATTKPTYTQVSQWNVAFKDFTLYCSPDPSTSQPERLNITDIEQFKLCVTNSIFFSNSSIVQCLTSVPTTQLVDTKPQAVGRVDVALRPLNSDQNFQFYTPAKNVATLGVYYSIVSLGYPDGLPKEISLPALNLAVTNAFTTSDVTTVLILYFLAISITLFENCIVPACSQIVSTCSPLTFLPIQFPFIL